jgi:Protein of unknown function (DUF3987)
MTIDVNRLKAKFLGPSSDNGADAKVAPVPRISGNGIHGAEPAPSEKAALWGDPDWSILDDRRGELPDFPINTLSAPCQEWVERAAHGAGVTPAHVAAPLLGIASALIGTGRRSQASRSWTQPMTTWIGMVGFSGSGKTPGIDAPKRALAQIEHHRRSKIASLELAHDTRVEAAKAAREKWKKEVEAAIEAGKPGPQKPVAALIPDRSSRRDCTYPMQR